MPGGYSKERFSFDLRGLTEETSTVSGSGAWGMSAVSASDALADQLVILPSCCPCRRRLSRLRLEVGAAPFLPRRLSPVSVVPSSGVSASRRGPVDPDNERSGAVDLEF